MKPGAQLLNARHTHIIEGCNQEICELLFRIDHHAQWFVDSAFQKNW
jgi:hypothetical protein